jgi:hypothetical protein
VEEKGVAMAGKKGGGGTKGESTKYENGAGREGDTRGESEGAKDDNYGWKTDNSSQYGVGDKEDYGTKDKWKKDTNDEWRKDSKGAMQELAVKMWTGNVSDILRYGYTCDPVPLQSDIDAPQG